MMYAYTHIHANIRTFNYVRILLVIGSHLERTCCSRRVSLLGGSKVVVLNVENVGQGGLAARTFATRWS